MNTIVAIVIGFVLGFAFGFLVKWQSNLKRKTSVEKLETEKKWQALFKV